ncbi:MAG: hypothetical protein KDB27_08365 [Planctomycetales bacterium]|nr:hypothetical protein [Planctomycetales bacterium]
MLDSKFVSRSHQHGSCHFARVIVQAMFVGCVLSSITSIAFGQAAGPALLAFPGAVGQGAVALGGRGGDVYHVTNRDDYGQLDAKIPGSLRDGIESASGPRTIVFDVGGGIELSRPLVISQDRLTLAGQTSPTGVSVWGYNTLIANAEDVVVRYLRFRTGDFNAMRTDENGTPLEPRQGNGRMDLIADSADALSVVGSNRVILDHVSAAWGMDESLSVTLSKNVTVQHSLIFNSLNDSFHYKGAHGYGSLVRGEVTVEEHANNEGGYTFYGNLWAHNTHRNPSFGGQQNLDLGQTEDQRRMTDVNFINNVVFDWQEQANHRSNLGTVHVNSIGNYFVTGPATLSARAFNENGEGHTELFVTGNYLDIDRDGEHDGFLIEDSDARRHYVGFERTDRLMTPADSEPFAFVETVADALVSAEEAYDRLLASGGPSLWRDAIDQRVIDELETRTGGIINSQFEFAIDGKVPGIHQEMLVVRPSTFDRDRDGISDDFERMFTLDPNDPLDAGATNLSGGGYTNLEVYLDWLTQTVPEPTSMHVSAYLVLTFVLARRCRKA